MKCQKCNSTLILYPDGLDGEKICGKCGLVIGNAFTRKVYTQWTPEWWSNWNEQDSETLKDWLTTLRSVSCQLNIPNFPYREEAARTIRTQNASFSKSQKLSKNKRATVAALIHLTLKEYNKMRSIKEISKELSLDQKSVIKQAWRLNKILNLQKEPLKTQRKTAIDYLHECGGLLTLNKDVLHDAEATLIRLQRIGGNPMGLAAGAFYYSCKKYKVRISKEQIGEAFHISHRTVYTNQSRIKKLSPALKANVKISLCAEV